MPVSWLSRGRPHVPPDPSWLSAGELAYIASKPFTKRSGEFLIARWTMKTAVAAALSLDDDPRRLAGIEARHASDGAPELYVDGRPAGLDLSLTDRADWAVCVVGAPGTGLGCDLELVEPRSPAFVRDYLTEAEQAQVLDAPHHDLAANLLWSAKESALKVLRTGLRRDTRSVEVRVSSYDAAELTWSPFAVRTTEGEHFDGWWRRSGVFVLTTCSRAPGDVPPQALEVPSPLDAASPTHSWLARPVA